MAKQFYENRNPNDLNFVTKFECGNEEKRRWNDYLSSEKSDTDITWEREYETKWREEKMNRNSLTCIHWLAQNFENEKDLEGKVCVNKRVLHRHCPS
jgi:hypothetical protein